jgi:hypothetical protein
MTIFTKLHRSLIVASMIGTASTVLATTDARADAPCGDRAALLAQVAKEFGENPTAIGLASNGGVVELLSSTTGTWTLIITFATRSAAPGNGRTCLIAAGEGWQAKEPVPQVADRPV